MEKGKNRPRPWHLWLVGVLSSLWYLSGAYTFLMAQTGNLTDINAEQAAYYAAQPLWFIILTDVSLFSALVASLTLLLKHRLAFILFSISLTTILLTNIYEIVAGISRALVDSGAFILTIMVVIIAVLLLIYSWAMKKRGVLN